MEMDPVEKLFDSIAPVIGSQLDIEHWTTNDTTRFINFTKSYIAELCKEKRKRCREDDCDGTCGDHEPHQHESTDDAGTDDVKDHRMAHADNLFRSLDRVRVQLKKFTKFGSVEEHIVVPQHSPTFTADVPAVDVDAFLYDEADVESLISAGQLSRQYCIACKSMKLGDVQFISHSFSRDQLVFLFSYAFPQVLPAGREVSICDVGSRLGIVVAAAAYASTIKGHLPAVRFSKIVGIELNSKFCSVQTAILEKLKLTNRNVQILNADAISSDGLSAMAASDVVVLHNVFEWFVEEKEQLAVWHKVRAALNRKGQVIVAVPTFEESIVHLAHHFGCAQMRDEPAALEFISSWVDKVDLADCVANYVEERLGGDPDAPTDVFDDDEDQDAKEEVKELISLINIYVVK